MGHAGHVPMDICPTENTAEPRNRARRASGDFHRWPPGPCRTSRFPALPTSRAEKWFMVKNGMYMYMYMYTYIYIYIYIHIVNSIICLKGMPSPTFQHHSNAPIYGGSAIRGSSWSEKTAWPRRVDGCRVEGTNREV